MNSLLKSSQKKEKKYLGNILKEFINDSRKNIDNKMKIIIKILSSIKEENEQILLKSKKNFI